MSSIERVVAYHEASKHHFNRYAPGPGHLDWANQPSPFRRFEGAPVVKLSLAFEDAGPPFALLYDTGVIPSAEVSLASISRFFEHSLALSAWKVYGDSRWALRVNPSSGNLHPTEGTSFSGGRWQTYAGPLHITMPRRRTRWSADAGSRQPHGSISRPACRAAPSWSDFLRFTGERPGNTGSEVIVIASTTWGTR